MNSLFQKHRWMQVMWGLLLFAAGAITIIYTFANGDQEDSNVSLVLSIALAIVLFAYGFTIIFSSFLELKDKFFKYEILIGAFIVAVGIVFVLNIKLLQDIIVSLIAASLLTFGTVFAIRTIVAFVRKLKVWWIGMCIALAVLFIAGGVLCLIFRSDVVDYCYVVLGAVLILVGGGEIWLTIKRAMEANNIGIEQKGPVKEEKKEKVKKDKKAKKEEPVEPVKPAPEVFDNEVPEQLDGPKAIPEFDASESSDEDKNELVIKE